MQAIRKYMAFVDGTNLLVQLSSEIGIEFRADKPPLACFPLARALVGSVEHHNYLAVRRYWFASYQGSEAYHLDLCTALRKSQFEPVLFKKRRGGREKGVAIALAKEMLVNAFNQNFDVTCLVAGDEDYVGLVNEAKRYGPIVTGAFFLSHGLAEPLRLAFDSFEDLGGLKQMMEEHLPRIKAEIASSKTRP